MERSDLPDLSNVIERERASRQTLIQVRQLVREFGRVDPTAFSPEDWRGKAVRALQVAESSLEWGLATSKVLKGLVAAVDGGDGDEHAGEEP